MHPSCTQFSPGNVGVTLRPNPAFVPKVVGSYSPIDLRAFSSSPVGLQPRLLCPDCALHTYIDKMNGIRRSDQLLHSYKATPVPLGCRGNCFVRLEPGFATPRGLHVWRHPGPCSEGFRTIVQLQADRRHSHLFAFTCWTSPLHLWRERFC